MNTKQIIVFRKDLLKGEHSIRKGKFAAQVAHASLGALLECFNKKQYHLFSHENNELKINTEQTLYDYQVTFGEDSVLHDWLNGKFTKIVVSVENEEGLLALNEQLNQSSIPHKLIIDSGLTEFHGVPTPTCLGIGPYISEEIDKFTWKLSLL